FPRNFDRERLLELEHNVQKVDRLGAQVADHCRLWSNLLIIDAQRIDQGGLHFLINLVLRHGHRCELPIASGWKIAIYGRQDAACVAAFWNWHITRSFGLYGLRMQELLQHSTHLVAKI